MGGDTPLPRDISGNQQVAVMCRSCHELASVGALFSIENPSDSLMFRSDDVVDMMRRVPCWFVKFDQCAFQLTLPGAPPNTYCRKRTAMLANFGAIEALGVKCPGISKTHVREHAWGKRDGVSLTAAAGRYPPPLCAALAAIVKSVW